MPTAAEPLPPRAVAAGARSAHLVPDGFRSRPRGRRRQLRRACRRDAGHRGRIRLRQERLRQVDHAPARRAGADRRRLDPVQGPRPRASRRRRHSRGARPRDRHGVPGPHDVAEPGPAHCATARRGDDGARPLHAGGGAPPRDRPAAAHGRGLGRPHREFVPASILRRHAPARDAGHGLLQRAFAAHRGRTDHGARRDDPGADPGPAARAEPRPRHRRHPDQPRPRRDRQYLLARAGDVRRRGGRGRRARGSADRSAPSLHLGAAARRAAHRCADRGSPADHHRGPAAGPARLAIRLPLSGALPLCHREMRGASRAAAGGSRRAGGRRGAG